MRMEILLWVTIATPRWPSSAWGFWAGLAGARTHARVNVEQNTPTEAQTHTYTQRGTQSVKTVCVWRCFYSAAFAYKTWLTQQATVPNSQWNCISVFINVDVDNIVEFLSTLSEQQHIIAFLTAGLCWRSNTKRNTVGLSKADFDNYLWSL